MSAITNKFLALAIVGFALIAVLGCQAESTAESTPVPASSATTPSAAISTSTANTKNTNQLRMLIDGVEWQFNQELLGGLNPISEQPELIISGSRGPNDASEQTFTLIIRGADKPGSYHVKSGDKSGSVAQISGLSEQEFLAGNMMPFDLRVEVIELSRAPNRMVARFEGSLQSNTGRTLQISKGHFSFQE